MAKCRRWQSTFKRPTVCVGYTGSHLHSDLTKVVPDLNDLVTLRCRVETDADGHGASSQVVWRRCAHPVSACGGTIGVKWGVQQLHTTCTQLASARNQRVTVKRGGGGDWLDAFGARVGWRNEKVRCALQDLILLHVIHWPWASSGSEVDISSQGTSATPLARRARAVRSARMAMSSLSAGPKAKLSATRKTERP